MKKTFCFLIVLNILIVFPVVIFGQNNASQFERQKVGVISSQNDIEFVQMVEEYLGKDKRFEFIDKSKIPAIVKEMARRQSGITEEDDTDNLVLKNIDYLISLENISQNSYVVSLTKTRTVGEGKDQETVSYTVYQMKTNISGNLKVVEVKKGGEVKVSTISGSGTSGETRSRYAAEGLVGQSRSSAMKSFKSSLQYNLKKMFPIISPVYAVKYGTLKLGRGASSGIKSGQRFMLTQSRKVKLPHKTITEKNEVGYIQVTKVLEENAIANIIFADDGIRPDNTTAKEKLFSEVGLEFFGAGRQFSGDFNPHLSIFNAGGGSRTWFQFFGGILESGLGFHFNVAGVDIYNMSFDWNIRVNIHLVRRFSVFFNIGLSLEIGWMNRAVDVGGDSYDEDISSAGMGFIAGGGFKFVFTEHIYLTLGYEYTLPIVSYDKWTLSDAGDEESSNLREEFLVDNQDHNFKDFSDNFNFDGMRVILTIGFFF